MDGLAGDAEGLGDLAPAPAGTQGLLDLSGLEQVGEAAQGDDGGEAVGGAVWVGDLDDAMEQP